MKSLIVTTLNTLLWRPALALFAAATLSACGPMESGESTPVAQPVSNDSQAASEVLDLDPLLASGGDWQQQVDSVSNALLPTGQADAVLFIHGFSPTASSATNGGHDCTNYFYNLVPAFYNWGYRGELKTVGYYTANTNCGYTLQSYGSSLVHFNNGNNTFTNNIDIRHLGYRLAWMIYNRYTSQGKTVSIVAHSMGGLVARYAVGQVAKRNADFPPALYVRTLVTMGTPNNGSLAGAICGGASGTLQCQQMAPGSAFLNDLNNFVDNGNSGVKWRLKMASNNDFVAFPDSAVQGGAGTQLIYGLPTYGHGDYQKDVSLATDAVFFQRTDSSQNYTEYRNVSRSGRVVYNYATINN